MPKFNSIKDAHDFIAKKLIEQVDEVLAGEVFGVVRDAQQKAIQEEVYSVYQPSVYRRREENGGLADPNNIQMESEPKNGVLSVINITRPNINRGSYSTSERTFKRIVRNAAKKSLPEQIEYGHGDPYRYDFPRDGENYMEARPFTETTRDMLRASREHIKALRKGLKKRKVNIVN